MYEKIAIFGIIRGIGRIFFAFFAGTFKISLAILTGVCYTVSVKVAGREFVPPDDLFFVKNGARSSRFSGVLSLCVALRQTGRVDTECGGR